LISILQTSAEVDAVCQQLSSEGLFLHQTPQKNWDHAKLMELLQEVPKAARILDLGSGGGPTLLLMHQLGYRDLAGMDFVVPQRKLRDRVRHALQPEAFHASYAITQGDICKTGLPDAQYDLITCVSVLEHDVDVDSFMKEAARLLKDGGQLFATVDYWEDFDQSKEEVKAVCGLPWNLFNRERLAALVTSARAYGLEPIGTEEIPACGDRPVSYAGRDYTFAAVVLRKHGTGS